MKSLCRKAQEEEVRGAVERESYNILGLVPDQPLEQNLITGHAHVLS